MFTIVYLDERKMSSISIFAEMDELEADPSFNPALKFMEEKPEAEKQVTVAAQEEVTPSDAGSDQGAAACGEDAMSGFALFEEQAAAEKPKCKKKFLYFSHVPLFPRIL